MKYKIISDSSCDVLNDYLDGKDIDFSVIPFVVNILEKEFPDDGSDNVIEMLAALSETQEKASSACPSPQAFYESMTADYNFVVTISSQLSGSYNSACVAKEMAEKEGKKVCVIDSKATCGIQVLIIDELVKLIEKETPFEDIEKQILEYVDKRNLVFVLRNFDNLIRNGRMLKIVAKFAKALNITPICIKNPIGAIDMKDKIMGAKKTIKRMVEMIGENATDLDNGDIIISHCLDDVEVETIKQKIHEAYPQVKNVRIIPTRTLASFYALEQGVIISY